MNPGIPKYIGAAAFFAAALFSAKYLLPLFLPFLLGAGLAVAAEPLVAFLSNRLRLRRGIASGIGITAAFCLCYQYGTTGGKRRKHRHKQIG